ncbi:MAG: serine/threonine protein kinase [Deltaproteobacteria bacterium]|nr:serine/threonine protein kinase [Nannocystaceae bacterium]
MGQDDPEDELLARLRSARPGPAGLDIGDRACIARLTRLKGGCAEVAAGGYVIEKMIGEGSYGTVYRARHPRIAKHVALKRLKPEVARQMGSVARSLREANLLGKLNHPNIVQVFDVIEDGDDTFIAMEYVDGEPLQRWQQEPRAWQEVLSVYLQVGDGLAAAHAAGLLHLDMKPGNVLVGRDGRVRVVDFGLARQVSLAASDENGETLVEPLPARGTVPYSSPEQRAMGEIDARSDQFSFCVALYEALYGELPFTASELADLRYVGFDRPARGARGRIPRQIGAALRQGLARDPSARWPGMTALLRTLRQRLDGGRVAALTGLVALVAACASALSFTAARPSCPDDDRIDEAWNPGRAQNLAAVFTSTAVPWADVAFDTAARSFDSYVVSWREAHDSACEARRTGARSDEHFDLAMGCLDLSRSVLDDVVSELMTADAASVARMEAVLSSLPPPSGCRDAATSGLRPAWPDDGVRDVVFQAELAQAMGRHRKALMLIDSLPPTAQSVPFVAASLSSVRGRAFEALGDAAAARQHYLEAIAASEAAGRNEIVPRLWQDLVGLTARDLADENQAAAWLVLYDGAVRRASSPGTARADYEASAAAVDMMRDAPEAAERRLRVALGIYADEGALGNAQEVSARVALGTALFAQGQRGEALRLFEAAIVQRRNTLGASHPDVAKLHHNVAVSLASMGDHILAVPEYERALELLVEASGHDSVQIAPVLSGLSSSLLALGRIEPARKAATHAMKVQERLPQIHEYRHSGLAALANVEIEAKNFQVAHALHLEILRSPSLAPAERAVIEHNIAWYLCEFERCTGANEHLVEAMRDAPADGLFRLYLSSTRARIESSRGNTNDARLLATQALAELDTIGIEDLLLEAELRDTLAASIPSVRATKYRETEENQQ